MENYDQELLGDGFQPLDGDPDLPYEMAIGGDSAEDYLQIVGSGAPSPARKGAFSSRGAKLPARAGKTLKGRSVHPGRSLPKVVADPNQKATSTVFQLGPAKTYDMMGYKVTGYVVYGALVLPSLLVNQAEPWVKYLAYIADAMKKSGLASLEAPWVVSSVKTTMLGQTRTDSPSHSRGFAIDLAPMPNASSFMEENRRSPLLATDIVSLSLLSQIDHRCLTVVEGDHLHVVAVQTPQDWKSFLLTFPTLVPWYRLASHPAMKPLKACNLWRNFHLFSYKTRTYSPAPDDLIRKFTDLAVSVLQ